MQALITLPPEFTTLPQTFRKINKTVYYEQKSKRFYKITVAQPLTMFIGQNLVTRQNLILTKYDPAYLALHILAEENVINVAYIPSYLNQTIFQQFTDRDGDRLKANDDKILGFLEKRIDRLNEVIDANQYIKLTKKLDFVSKDKNTDNRKPIKSEIIQILRKDVPELYLEDILRTRYHEQHKVMKPVVTDNYFEEVEKQQNKDKLKNKKKPPSKANIVQPLPKNQPTLFQFGGKKQSKGSLQ